MSEESIILQVLAQFRNDVAELTSAVGEVKAELVGVTLQMSHIVNRMDIANGRTSKLEDRVDLIERREIREDGIEDGRREQREAYAAAASRAWTLLWTPAGRVIGGALLLATGWTLREVWPW